MRNIGVGLVVLAYVVLLFTSSVGVAYTGDAGIGLTQARWHIDPMMISIAIAGIMLELIPVRRGERWAQVTQSALLLNILMIRFYTGAKRLVLLDLHQQSNGLAIMIFLLAIAGLLLTSPWTKLARAGRIDAGRVQSGVLPCHFTSRSRERP